MGLCMRSDALAGVLLGAVLVLVAVLCLFAGAIPGAIFFGAASVLVVYASARQRTWARAAVLLVSLTLVGFGAYAVMEAALGNSGGADVSSSFGYVVGVPLILLGLGVFAVNAPSRRAGSEIEAKY
jgi:hypothetical protein